MFEEFGKYCNFGKINHCKYNLLHHVSTLNELMLSLPGGQHAATLASWNGSSVFPTQTPIWSQICSMGFMSGLWAYRVTRYVGRIIVLDIHKFRPKTSPRKHTYRGEAWCSVGAWGFHPAALVHLSQHGGWHPIPWLTKGPQLRPVGWMYTSISLSPCLWCTRARPAPWNSVKRDITEDTAYLSKENWT